MNNQFELDVLLKRMAEVHQPQLPTPGLIWWRAQILKKQKEKELIERPLIIMHGLATITCLIALLVLLVGNWSQLEGAPGSATHLLMPLLIIALSVSAISAFLMSRWPKSRA
jgi:hypothetical protein